jgi:hypothetical protein
MWSPRWSPRSSLSSTAASRWTSFAVVLLLLLVSPGLALLGHGPLRAPPPREFSVTSGASETPVVRAMGSMATASPRPSTTVQISLIVYPTQLLLGSQLTFTFEVSGGVSPYRLAWGGMPPGCTITPTSTGESNPTSFQCVPSKLGDFPIDLGVADNATPDPNTALSPAQNVTVYSQLMVTLGVSPSTVSVGGHVTVDYQVTGGMSPYQLEWSGLPNGCSDPPASLETNTPSSFACTPMNNGGYQVSLNVYDNASPSRNFASPPSAQLSVDPQLSVSLTVSQPTATLGQPLSFTYQINGGSSPYELTWTGLPGGCPSPPTSVGDNGGYNLQCFPNETGRFTASLSASDSASPTRSTASSSEVPLLVLAPLTASLEISPTVVNVSSPVTIGFQITGGLSPYTLSWSNLPVGCTNAPRSVNDDALEDFVCSPTQSGGTEVGLSVTDSAMPSHDSSSAGSQQLSVVSPNGGGGNGNGNNGSKGGPNGGNSSGGSFSGIELDLLLLVFGISMAANSGLLIIVVAIATISTTILLARRLPPRARKAAASASPCPKCGEAAPVGARFCPACAQPMGAEPPKPKV